MLISGLTGGWSMLASLVTGATASAAAVGELEASPAVAGSTKRSAGEQGDILLQAAAEHDLSRITPAQFAALAQELFESGGLRDGEANDLAGITLDLQLGGAAAGEPLDLMQWLHDKVRRLEQKLQSAADPAEARRLEDALDLSRRQLDWAEKFQTLRANGVTRRLDAVA